MYYTYILQCDDGSRYYGHTCNLSERLKCHKKGSVQYTRSRRPVYLVWFKVSNNRLKARQEEVRLKKLHHRKSIDVMIREFPKELLTIFETEGVKEDACKVPLSMEPYKHL